MARPESMNVGDLQLLTKLVDAGSERGAWKGEELSVIGAVRTKMIANIQYATPTPIAPTEETTTTTKTIERDENDLIKTITETKTPSKQTKAKAKPKRKRAAKPTAA